MTLTELELRKLTAKCNKIKDGPDYRENDYVKNLLITVLDFQMNVKTVSAALRYFRNNHNIETHEALKSFVYKYPDTKEGNKKLSNDMWDNNHWSRAGFLRKLIEEFEKRDIKDQQSLKKFIESSEFEKDIKGKFRTEKHSIGVTLFQWLRLRVGIETVKPDVHILRFVSNVLGRKITRNEAVAGLLYVAAKTNREPALLDSAIWNYQKHEKLRATKI